LLRPEEENSIEAILADVLPSNDLITEFISNYYSFWKDVFTELTNSDEEDSEEEPETMERRNTIQENKQRNENRKEFNRKWEETVNKSTEIIKSPELNLKKEIKKKQSKN